MSDSEEESFCYYGKALDPFDEDLFPKKRPITVEEQIATDSNGRRRFHGAFTGGFSAGFFNTVGSLEGWTPKEFKSSRSEKQKRDVQNPEDFMDDEDLGEFGFAPQSIKATKDYDTSKKRKRQMFPVGPIPGEPVLHTLLTTGNDTVGYMLLKNIGIKEKVVAREKEISGGRVYGCEIPNTSIVPDLMDKKEYKLPTFYEDFLSKPKNNTFGLGYTGLDRSNINLFKSSDLIVQEKGKKLSIRGQAFGVGAFERDDDDIYAKEDMSSYDFELTKEKDRPKVENKMLGDVIFDFFTKSKVNLSLREVFPPPVIPKSFTGKHKLKKSRFEPLETFNTEVHRKTITSAVRAEILGEEVNRDVTPSKSILSTTPGYVRALAKEEVEEKPSMINLNQTSDIDVPSKDISGNRSSITSKESFSDNLWNDRFVSAVQDDEATNILAPVKKFENDHYGKEMKDAAKLKMFGPLTRISQDWQPCSLLCKRFNVPEPMLDKPKTSKVRTKTRNLIFEYQKHYEENLTMKAGLTPSTSNIQDNQPVAPNDEVPPEMCCVDVKKEIEEVKEEENINVAQELPTDDITDKKNSTEEIIDITDKLNIEEKGDLFKSIFLSSSESEEEPVDKNENTEIEKEDVRLREEELKSNILGRELLLPKIKPVKEGILSDIKFNTFHSVVQPFRQENEREMIHNDNLNSSIHGNINTNDDSGLNLSSSSCSNVKSTDTYGPRLPEKKLDKTSVNNSSIYSIENTNSSSDEWVEKDHVAKLKKKKHKKDKSSHKKKSKHKKKKK